MYKLTSAVVLLVSVPVLAQSTAPSPLHLEAYERGAILTNQSGQPMVPSIRVIRAGDELTPELWMNSCTNRTLFRPGSTLAPGDHVCITVKSPASGYAVVATAADVPGTRLTVLSVPQPAWYRGPEQVTHTITTNQIKPLDCPSEMSTARRVELFSSIGTRLLACISSQGELQAIAVFEPASGGGTLGHTLQQISSGSAVTTLAQPRSPALPIGSYTGTVATKSDGSPASKATVIVRQPVWVAALMIALGALTFLVLTWLVERVRAWSKIRTALTEADQPLSTLSVRVNAGVYRLDLNARELQGHLNFWNFLTTTTDRETLVRSVLRWRDAVRAEKELRQALTGINANLGSYSPHYAPQLPEGLALVQVLGRLASGWALLLPGRKDFVNAKKKELQTNANDKKEKPRYVLVQPADVEAVTATLEQAVPLARIVKTMNLQEEYRRAGEIPTPAFQKAFFQLERVMNDPSFWYRYDAAEVKAAFEALQKARTVLTGELDQLPMLDTREALDGSPQPWERVALPPRGLTRMQRYMHIAQLASLSMVLFALGIGTILGLGILYHTGQPWGTSADHLAAFAWGAGTLIATQGLVALLGKINESVWTPGYLRRVMP